jgi:hypothetical protein
MAARDDSVAGICDGDMVCVMAVLGSVLSRDATNTCGKPLAGMCRDPGVDKNVMAASDHSSRHRSPQGYVRFGSEAVIR